MSAVSAAVAGHEPAHEEGEMNLAEALGIAAHLRNHAMPDDADESIDARRTKTVISLANEVERLRAMEERAEELHTEPRRGTDSWDRGRYDAADYILTGKTS